MNIKSNYNVLEVHNPRSFSNIFCALKYSQNPGVRGSVDNYPEDWYIAQGCRMFVIPNSQCNCYATEIVPSVAVCAVTVYGELVSLCASPGHAGDVKKMLMEVLAITKFRYLRCLETDKLRNLYASIGLRRICGMPWDSDLAPKNWDAKRFGRPPFMVYASPYCAKYERLTDDKTMLTRYDALVDHLKAFGIDF